MTNQATVKLQDKDIEIVDFYVYLGMVFNYNGSFGKAREKLVNQARRSLYSLFTLPCIIYAICCIYVLVLVSECC